MSHELSSMESSPATDPSPIKNPPATDPEMDSGNEVTTRHDYFYFSEVVFLVEDSLFKVPRESFVENSDFFRAMFQLPVPNGAFPDGSSDKNPLRLDGIEKTDFLQLLKVMFPRFPRETKSMTWTQWFSVLKLATMWEMDEMREEAIERIVTLPSSVQEWIEVLKVSTSRRAEEVRNKAIAHLSQNLRLVHRVSLAAECHVLSWFVLGCRELVFRDETISESDEECLGSQTTIKLLRLRDRLSRRFRSSTVPVVDEAIYKVFDAEVKEAEYLDE